ncbi:MAG: hypothetical protein JSW11_00920 [Candidatus Heimdallarchaeota archaeon]|nr:MAG: hypothetical protein JSW11_00920 [Candidatus Heimdallarchaeota archaeon]
MQIPKIQSIQIIFELPDWTTEDKFDQEIPIYYEKGHIREGQIKTYEFKNYMSKQLFSISTNNIKIVETCLIPGYASVTVQFCCSVNDLKKQIHLFQHKSQKLLINLYKELET